MSTKVLAPSALTRPKIRHTPIPVSINCPLSEVQVGDRHRKDLGDLKALAGSIAELGLLHPIGLDSEHKLIFGCRRLEACRLLGWNTIPARVFRIGPRLQAEYDENELHKAFTVSERTALYQAIKAQMKAAGERRGRPSENVAHLHHISKTAKTPGKGERTAEKAARQAGFQNRDEARRAELVATKSVEMIRACVDDGTITLSDAAAIASEPRDIQNEALNKVSYGHAKTLVKAAEMVKAERKAIERTEIKDMLGQVVPLALRPLIAEIPHFQRIQDVARSLRSELGALDKLRTSERRRRGELQGLCKEIELEMAQQRFGFVCPKCLGGGDKSCPCCAGALWFFAGDANKSKVREFVATKKAI